MSLVLSLPRKMHLCRSSSNVPRLTSLLEMLQNPHVLLTFGKVHTIPCACHAKRHLNFQKWSEPLMFLTFWLRNVLRATTAYTFLTSQLPIVVRTLLFLFLTFWLRNVLRATTACTFSTSQLPKVVRTWCVLCVLTWKCASRHNGVQLFISHLASWLRTRRFSEPTFPPEPQIIGKTQCFATFLPFRAPGSSFFWDFLFFDLLSSSLLFSDSSHLCFSFVHIVGSLTSKLPSIKLL